MRRSGAPVAREKALQRVDSCQEALKSRHMGFFSCPHFLGTISAFFCGFMVPGSEGVAVAAILKDISRFTLQCDERLKKYMELSTSCLQRDRSIQVDDVSSIRARRICPSARLLAYRNKRFGRLTAIDFIPIDGEHKWLCKCDCGNTVYATTYLLRIGNVQSCGCRKTEASQFNAKKARANNGVAYGTDIDKIKKASTTIKGRGESGYRGVYLNPAGNKKYRARITFRGKKYDMGCFERLEDAVAARQGFPGGDQGDV